METNILHRFVCLREKFKSYYVVWKLSDMSSQAPAVRVFKSYYVVWKHFLKSKNTADEKEV